MLDKSEMNWIPAPVQSKRPLFILLAAIITIVGVVVGIRMLGGRRITEPATGGGFASPPPSAANTINPVQGKSTVSPPAVEVKKNPIPNAQTPTEKPAVEPEPEALISTHNTKGFPEQTFFNRTVMVHIPAGNFTVGSPSDLGNNDEHPDHKVYIGDFWLGKYEVTFEQYDFFCHDTWRQLPNDEGWGRGNRPVINVTWDDAQDYCAWLSKKTARKFRLPSEAEWEKAARSKYPWGKDAPTAKHVNMKGSEDGFPFTAPVGSFPRGESHYGVLDMAGNVWEWISDWYGAEYFGKSPRRDPRGPLFGAYRVVRGGSWKNGPELTRSSNRNSEKPDRRSNVVGFRIAMGNR